MAEEMIMNNKQIILKHYVEGYPKESDMEFKNNNIKLNVPEGSNVVVLKNLYLSCDPYMRNRMSKLEGSYIQSFTPGYVSISKKNNNSIYYHTYDYLVDIYFCLTFKFRESENIFSVFL